MAFWMTWKNAFIRIWYQKWDYSGIQTKSNVRYRKAKEKGQVFLASFTFFTKQYFFNKFLLYWDETFFFKVRDGSKFRVVHRLGKRTNNRNTNNQHSSRKKFFPYLIALTYTETSRLVLLKIYETFMDFLITTYIQRTFIIQASKY